MADTPTVASTSSTFANIPIDKIKPSRYQARKDFNEASIQALAASMKEEGLIQPITVRECRGRLLAPLPNESGQSESDYELISGERRLRAAKLLGWTSIEAKVIEPVSEGESAAKGLIENLQREDLNPIEEAEGFQEMLNLKDPHWTQAQIGKACGKPQSRISESIRLLGLPEVIQENIRQRIFSREHGIELLRLDGAKLQKAMAKKLSKKGWSVKQTREAIDKKLGKEPAAANGKSKEEVDPLTEFWPQAHSLSRAMQIGDWKAGYKDGAWILTYAPADPASAKAGLARWLKWLGHLIDMPNNGGNMPEELVAPLAGNTLQARRMSFSPTNRADAERAFAELKNLHMPKTPEEKAELEKLALESVGPGPMYARVFGENSWRAERFKGVSWLEAGYKDAASGYKQLMSDLQLLVS